MKNKQNTNILKRLGIWAIITAAILMIPLILKAPWTMGDFIVASIVLFGAGSSYELITKNMKNSKNKIVIGIIVILAVIFFWGFAVA